MPKEGKLRLRILDAEHNHLRKTVEVGLKHQELSDSRVLQVDASQDVLITGLYAVPRGLYQIRVTVDDCETTSQFVNIKSSGVTELEITIPEKITKYRVYGIVTGTTGQPISGALVSALDTAIPTRATLAQTTTNDGGRYTLALKTKHQPAMEVAIRVADETGRPVVTTEQPVRIRPFQDVRVDITAPGLEFGAARTEITYITGQPVNLKAAAALSTEELIAAYRHLRRRPAELPRPELVRRAFPRLFGLPDPQDDCGEGRLEVIRVLLEERGGLRHLAESDADDLPPGATVKWFYTDRVRVKYTTDSGFPNDRVDPTTPSSDQAFTLSDGTVIGTLRQNLADLHPDNTELAPTYVQKVGLIAEHALGRYLSSVFGFRDPRNGASRLEYRILQMPAGVSGQTNASWSHVEVGPDNTDIQNLHTVPHEMFHQVQYRYNNTTTRSGIYGAVREGGARLMEDSINDAPNRYVDTASAIFSDPTQSLADSPSVSTSVSSSTPIRYAAGLFWKYIAEQHSTRVSAADEPAIGIDSYRQVLDATATVAPGDPGLGYDPPALRDARANMPWYGWFDQFSYYDAAMTELGSHETTWGNYMIANYLHGTGTPVADGRFEYKEDEEPVSWPGSSIASLATLQAAVETVSLSQGSNITRNVTGHKAWAAKYYRVNFTGSPGPRLLQVNFTSSGGLIDPLVQIVRLAAGMALVDINRSDQASFSKTINLNGLSSVVVIAASRANAGNFTVQFQELAAAGDTMITRWNSSAGTEYEVDPRGWSWTWVSPDVMVDNNGDDLADTEVFFGQNNVLKVRLRNRGNQNASGIQIDYWYQKATPFLTSSGWIPLQDAGGVTQQITGATLAAGAEQWFSVNWAPVDDGTHHPHWCVKVRVTVAGEPNSDNKMALSNFSRVVPGGDGDVPFLTRLSQLYNRAELAVVPRGPRWTLVPPELPQGSVVHPCRCVEGAVAKGPTRAVLTRMRLAERPSVSWDGIRRGPRPDEGTYYAVDESTLPPGADPSALVTVAQFVDGELVGGVTYEVASRFGI